jgi:hypothetical protein
MGEVRLFVSVPSCREWKPAFGSSFVGLNVQLVTKGVKGHTLTNLYPEIAAQASCLSQARQSSLTKAINGGFTHWLSLDDDMQFPQTIVDDLIAHHKPIVTANYRRKNADVVSGVCMGLDGQIIDSTGKTGLEQIGWMGGGMFLANIESIQHIPAPHFEVSWCEERQDYYDQDNYFSAKLRQHGIELWCDHDLSQKIAHVGDYHFKFPGVK